MRPYINQQSRKNAQDDCSSGREPSSSGVRVCERVFLYAQADEPIHKLYITPFTSAANLEMFSARSMIPRGAVDDFVSLSLSIKVMKGGRIFRNSYVLDGSV